MNTLISKELAKRIKADKVVCGVVTIVAGLGTLLYLVRFITTLLSQNYAANDLQGYAYAFTEIAFITGGLLCLYLAMKEIAATGKPFSKAIVTKLLTMGILFVVSVPIAALVTSLAGFLDPTALTIGYHISIGDIAVLLFGAIMLMISEIFRYGMKLEEEMEQIA